MIRTATALPAFLASLVASLHAELPKLDVSFREATARTVADQLVVSTGTVERTFRWTGHGLVTTGFRTLANDHQWANRAPAFGADWSAPGFIPPGASTKLLSLTARRSDDQGFTTPHLEVVAEVAYPELQLTLKQTIWAYPGAQGLRQQLWAKGQAPAGLLQPEEETISDPSHPSRTQASGRVDHLPVDTSSMKVSAAGYYSDTQHRNTPETPVLREETLGSAGDCDWANLLFIEDGDQALTLIKESHKTVQTPGVDTGLYRYGGDGIENTGWCLRPSELSPGEYKWLWGSWVIAHDAGPDAREQAVKAFDRLRFPTDKARDMWMVMCTWGHSKVMGSGGNGRTYAYEKEVLAEMDHVADLGIDMLLIDDGWQAPAPFDRKKYPQPHEGWYPHPGLYPTGDWSRVTAKAEKLGLRLGLWADWRISNEEMLWNWQRLKPHQFKLDFANLRSHTAVDSMKMKARNFMLQSGRRCIISWDTTEAAPRYGYYLFREYGNVHFMNRKPEEPGNVLYVPWLALRDFWLLARYQNLNKWQLVIQNPEVTVERAKARDGKITASDARLHGVDYCAATALMGTPEFMAVTRYYSEEARQLLRTMLDRYKAVRSEIWDSTVYAIGDEPSNSSWTGFQAVHPNGKSGFLTIFRELHNPEGRATIPLRFLKPGTELKLTDLMRGVTQNVTLDEQGAADFQIDPAPGFLFIEYRQP